MIRLKSCRRMTPSRSLLGSASKKPMKKHTQTDMADAPRILVACQREADACRVIGELEKMEHLEIQNSPHRKSLAAALASFQPDVVIADNDYNTFSALRSVREIHPHIPFILIGSAETLSVALGKGINISILKEELSRLGPWIQILLLLKAHGGEETDQSILNQISLATARPSDKIYSSSLDDLRVQAHRLAKTPEERETALIEWTKEIEQKKLAAALYHQNDSYRRTDPLFPAVDEKISAHGMLPAPSTTPPPAEPHVQDIKKMQSEMACQLARLNAEIKEIKQQKNAEYQRRASSG